MIPPSSEKGELNGLTTEGWRFQTFCLHQQMDFNIIYDVITKRQIKAN